MKELRFLGLIACLALFAGCASNETSGGRQEAKRREAMEKQKQQEAQTDEGQRNLYNAHQDMINRDSNAVRY